MAEKKRLGLPIVNYNSVTDEHAGRMDGADDMDEREARSYLDDQSIARGIDDPRSVVEVARAHRRGHMALIDQEIDEMQETATREY